jgi:hypothetical protein
VGSRQRWSPHFFGDSQASQHSTEHDSFSHPHCCWPFFFLPSAFPVLTLPPTPDHVTVHPLCTGRPPLVHRPLHFVPYTVLLRETGRLDGAPPALPLFPVLRFLAARQTAKNTVRRARIRKVRPVSFTRSAPWSSCLPVSPVRAPRLAAAAAAAARAYKASANKGQELARALGLRRNQRSIGVGEVPASRPGGRGNSEQANLQYFSHFLASSPTLPDPLPAPP